MKTIFTLLLLLLSTSSYANERWYQIELLVFANNSAQGLIGERWRQPEVTPLVENVPMTLEDTIADSRYYFESVSESDKQLLDSVAKIRNHWQYQTLLYSAWKQGFTKDAAAIPVYIDNQVVVKQADAFAQSATQFNERFGDGFSSEDLDAISNQPTYELSGTAAVTLKRYLHLELKLNYNRLLNNKDKEQVRAIYQSLETDYLSFKIDESRRMRSKQAHYFDHPTFGVIALITPIEDSADNTNTEQLQIETVTPSDDNKEIAAEENEAASTAPLQ